MNRRWWILLVLLLAVPACSSNDRWRLDGHWHSNDTDPATLVHFNGTGGVVITLASGEEIPGRYTLLAGEYVDIDLHKSWHGLKKHREKIKVSDNVLFLTDSDGTRMRFQRDFKW